MMQGILQTLKGPGKAGPGAIGEDDKGFIE
jgi:hypothetical protein